MKPKGFDSIKTALDMGYDVGARPGNGEDRRYVDITFGDNVGHAELLNLLDGSGLMHDGRQPSQVPALRAIGFVANRVIFEDMAHERTR